LILADLQQYVGCYRDGEPGNRVLDGSRIAGPLMTIDMCQQFCQRSAETYFGLEVLITLRLQHFYVK